MKLIVSFVLFSLSVSSAIAQDIDFGVRGGLIATSYDAYAIDRKINGEVFNDYNNYYINGSNKSSVGFYGGFTVSFELLKDLELQPEINLVGVPGEYGYLAVSVPVMVKYSFFDKFYALAGPGASFATNAQRDNFSPTISLGATYDVLDNFYVELRAEFGLSGYLSSNLNAGVGYRF